MNELAAFDPDYKKALVSSAVGIGVGGVGGAFLGRGNPFVTSAAAILGGVTQFVGTIGEQQDSEVQAEITQLQDIKGNLADIISQANSLPPSAAAGLIAPFNANVIRAYQAYFRVKIILGDNWADIAGTQGAKDMDEFKSFFEEFGEKNLFRNEFRTALVNPPGIRDEDQVLFDDLVVLTNKARRKMFEARAERAPS